MTGKVQIVTLTDEHDANAIRLSETCGVAKHGRNNHSADKHQIVGQRNVQLVVENFRGMDHFDLRKVR